MTHPHPEHGHVVVDVDERPERPLHRPADGPPPPPLAGEEAGGPPAGTVGPIGSIGIPGLSRPTAIVDEEPGRIVDEDASSEAALPAHAIVNNDGSVTLPLRAPRELQIRSATRGVRSQRFDQLTFHRLNGADLRAIVAAAPASRSAVMLARSARQREPVMNALFDVLDGEDIADAVKVVESFFGIGRPTGR